MRIIVCPEAMRRSARASPSLPSRRVPSRSGGGARRAQAVPRFSVGSLLLLVVLGACGGDGNECEVADASAEPTVFELNDAETWLEVRAETRGCDVETLVDLSAVIEDRLVVPIATLRDNGRDMDTEAGDGLYERTMENPFFGPDQVGAGALRFRPCDPDCREPALEIEIRVIPAQG